VLRHSSKTCVILMLASGTLLGPWQAELQSNQIITPPALFLHHCSQYLLPPCFAGSQLRCVLRDPLCEFSAEALGWGAGSEDGEAAATEPTEDAKDEVKVATERASAELPSETAISPSSPEAVRAPEVTHRVNEECHCKGHLLLRDCRRIASVLCRTTILA